jgi:hypothetical protein
MSARRIKDGSQQRSVVVFHRTTGGTTTTGVAIFFSSFGLAQPLAVFAPLVNHHRHHHNSRLHHRLPILDLDRQNRVYIDPSGSTVPAILSNLRLADDRLPLLFGVPELPFAGLDIGLE